MALTCGLRSPRDLLEKLKRDAALLDEEVTSDRFFNFVVTGYSIIDWVKNDPSSPSSAISAVETMGTDRWIKVCGDLANSQQALHVESAQANHFRSRVASRVGDGPVWQERMGRRRRIYPDRSKRRIVRLGA